jgi:hypothetical protein
MADKKAGKRDQGTCLSPYVERQARASPNPPYRGREVSDTDAAACACPGP